MGRLDGPKRLGGRMLEVIELTKRFGTKTAVDRVSFITDKPAMIGIIGKSGAGKSTLLRALNGLSKQTAGRILYEGREVSF